MSSSGISCGFTSDVILPLEYVRPTYRTAYKLPLGSSVLHLGQPQPQPFNLLIPNELRRCRAVRPLIIKIPSKNLVRQHCAEGFNFVAKRLKKCTVQETKSPVQNLFHIYIKEMHGSRNKITSTKSLPYIY